MKSTLCLIALLFAAATSAFAQFTSLGGSVTQTATSTSAQPPSITAPSVPLVPSLPPPIVPELVPLTAPDHKVATGKFLNLSTRGWVQGSDKILIAGLVVSTGNPVAGFGKRRSPCSIGVVSLLTPRLPRLYKSRRQSHLHLSRA